MQTQVNPQKENPRYQKFVDRVLDLGNDYDSAAAIQADLEKWSDVSQLYNIVNHSYSKDEGPVRYGYARLDAFGRIYNRSIQHEMSRQPVERKPRGITGRRGETARRRRSETAV